MGGPRVGLASSLPLDLSVSSARSCVCGTHVKQFPRNPPGEDDERDEEQAEDQPVRKENSDEQICSGRLSEKVYTLSW